MVAEAIRTRGYEARAMADVYPDGADQRVADPEWIERADREGWIALTKDPSIIRDHREVLAATTLRVFAFTNANLTGAEMVERLGTNFNRILQRARKPGPYVWAITPGGLQRRWPRD